MSLKYYNLFLDFGGKSAGDLQRCTIIVVRQDSTQIKSLKPTIKSIEKKKGSVVCHESNKDRNKLSVIQSSM